eukprot:1247096-Rhodomonas_salina.1
MHTLSQYRTPRSTRAAIQNHTRSPYRHHGCNRPCPTSTQTELTLVAVDKGDLEGANARRVRRVSLHDDEGKDAAHAHPTSSHATTRSAAARCSTQPGPSTAGTRRTRAACSAAPASSPQPRSRRRRGGLSARSSRSQTSRRGAACREPQHCSRVVAARPDRHAQLRADRLRQPAFLLRVARDREDDGLHVVSEPRKVHDDPLFPPDPTQTHRVPVSTQKELESRLKQPRSGLTPARNATNLPGFARHVVAVLKVLAVVLVDAVAVVA